jgi:hypothetical protein
MNTIPNTPIHDTQTNPVTTQDIVQTEAQHPTPQIGTETATNTTTSTINTTTTTTRISEPNVPAFKYLRRLNIRLIRSEHHLNYLLACTEKNTTPKGLTPWVTPNLPVHDPPFLEDWKQIHNTFSKALTSRLISYWQKVAEDTKTEIQNTNAALKLSCSTPEYDHILKLINIYTSKEKQNFRTLTPQQGWQNNTDTQANNQPMGQNRPLGQNNRTLNPRGRTQFDRTSQNRNPQFNRSTQNRPLQNPRIPLHQDSILNLAQAIADLLKNPNTRN